MLGSATVSASSLASATDPPGPDPQTTRASGVVIGCAVVADVLALVPSVHFLPVGRFDVELRRHCGEPRVRRGGYPLGVLVLRRYCGCRARTSESLLPL